MPVTSIVDVIPGLNTFKPQFRPLAAALLVSFSFNAWHRAHHTPQTLHGRPSCHWQEGHPQGPGPAPQQPTHHRQRTRQSRRTPRRPRHPARCQSCRQRHQQHWHVGRPHRCWCSGYSHAAPCCRPKRRKSRRMRRSSAPRSASGIPLGFGPRTSTSVPGEYPDRAAPEGVRHRRRGIP